jgi:hypothetical protein
MLTGDISVLNLVKGWPDLPCGMLLIPNISPTYYETGPILDDQCHLQVVNENESCSPSAQTRHVRTR